MNFPIKAAGLALALAPAPVLAHVSFETPEATQDAAYKAVLRIGHGCDGAATHTVRVAIPEGVIGVRPMPKPGWTLKTETGAYARRYDLHGQPVSSGVTAIVWSGGALADDHYDEFVFQTRVTDALPAGERLHVPVTQLCERGQHAWTEVPAEGQDSHALKSPAPAILIKAGVRQVAQASGHQGHGAPAAASPGAIGLSTPWARATPPGAKVAGGFFTIENKGMSADRLIGGSAEIAGAFEVHEMRMDGGMMKMRALDNGLAIPAGGKVELKPGGYHIMFLDLKRPLKEGESFSGALRFEKAGEMPVTFKVMPIGSTGAAQHGH